MRLEAVRTPLVRPGDSIEAVLDSLPPLEEGCVVAVTSKIVSVCEGRLVPKASCSKEELVRREADSVADVPDNPWGLYLTVAHGILTPSAAIDESNGEDVYILAPADPQGAAASIWAFLRKKHGLKNLGVIVTDSNVTPLRRGVTGVALGWCGFAPLYSYIGKPDLCGRPLRVTQANLIDALSTAAVLMMGEGDERTPLAVIRDAPKMTFMDRPPTAAESMSVRIPADEDLYAPLLTAARWRSRKKRSSSAA